MTKKIKTVLARGAPWPYKKTKVKKKRATQKEVDEKFAKWLENNNLK